jgi:hypothetical protein
MDLISRWRAGMPVKEQKKTKPGSFLRVLWKRDRATRANFAWWDSEDGIRGGKMLRCAVLEADRRAMKEFDLFPSGDQSAQLICVVTASEQTIEVPYVTFSFLRYSKKPRREREPAMHSDFSNMLAACPLSAPMRWDPLAWFL